MSAMRGFLRRTEAGVAGVLTDTFGYQTHITGVPAREGGIDGWAIEAIVVVPDGLKLPWEIDEISP
jgi:hypothetical protein